MMMMMGKNNMFKLRFQKIIRAIINCYNGHIYDDDEWKIQ